MREKILEILLDINPDVDYETEKNLIANGLFDSLEIMQIIVGLDTVFHVEVEAEDITAENFSSVDSICSLVKKYI